MDWNSQVGVAISEFQRDAVAAGIKGWPCELRVERQQAPHEPHSLSGGWSAVYVFMLSESYGRGVPAGPFRVLKVGKAGPRSNARFQSQHYGTSAPSTLAKSLTTYRTLWPWLGIADGDLSDIRRWMCDRLGRVDIYVPGDRGEVLSELETYVRARVGSVFEGAA